LSEKFKTIEEKNNFIIAYKLMNTLNSIIKSDKDRLERMEQCNVVYKIRCLDCDSSYVGQTKRKVKTRINKHKTNITLKCEVLPHPPYSPDIAPSDFHLFRSMAHGLADRRFHSYEEAQKWIDSWIASKDMSFFRWEKVVSSDGQYFK
ncbi:MOS1T transposase, partial [Pseudoatta argentina]